MSIIEFNWPDILEGPISYINKKGLEEAFDHLLSTLPTKDIIKIDRNGYKIYMAVVTGLEIKHPWMIRPL